MKARPKKSLQRPGNQGIRCKQLAVCVCSMMFPHGDAGGPAAEKEINGDHRKSVDTAPELSRMFWIWTATILLPLMLFGTANRTIEVPKMDHKWLGHAGSLMATNTRNTIFFDGTHHKFQAGVWPCFSPRVLTNSWPQETYAMMGINLEVMLQEMRASADVLPAAGEPGGDGLLG